jgi:polyisoprenoid-binding protein YceI
MKLPHVLLLLFLCGLPGTAGTVFAGAHEFVVDAANSSVKFTAHATAHTFTGTVKKWTLTAKVPDGSDVPESAAFSGEVTSMVTGDEARDKDMWKWFESEKFGAVEFRLKKITGEGDARVANGDLVIHGVTKSVDIPVKLERTDKALKISGAITIDHTEFGLAKIRKMALLSVDTKVKVEFVVAGTLK